MKSLKREVFRHYDEKEAATWKLLFQNLQENRREMAVPMFAEGIRALGLCADRMPSLDDVNARLKERTGWCGVPVEGLEPGDSFYPALARKEYPIGNFIRDAKDVNYTPAPDIFHDLYGHLPFFVDRAYADFCTEYGKLVSRYMESAGRLEMFERFFWFTIEFALMETPRGRRIFGAGILSSINESLCSLSDEPDVRAFDIETICNQSFRSDEIQPRLFVLESTEQLYRSLPDLERYVTRATG